MTYAHCDRCNRIVPGHEDPFGPDNIPDRNHYCTPPGSFFGELMDAVWKGDHEHDWRLFGSRWECVGCDANSDEEAGRP